MTDAPDLRPAFLEAMSRMAATVSVLTSDGPGGLAGVTVSSLTSLSADGPAPTLLACVHHLSPAAAAILTNRAFAANVLAEDQADLSDRFSGRTALKGDARFDGLALSKGPGGSPMIDGVAVSFDCQLVSSLLWQTHHLLIGQVQAIRFADPGRTALVYAARGYRRLAGLDG